MVGWCEKQNEEDILMDNSKKTMSSGKVFEMIMCALRCKSKVDAKHWIMWNGSFVKESFPDIMYPKNLSLINIPFVF